MGLRLMRKKRVMVKRILDSLVHCGVAPVFEETGHEIMVSVQPSSGRTKQELSGEERTEIRMLLADKDVAIHPGDGIVLERADGQCDFQVAEPVERWGGHLRAYVKRIREE